MPETHGLPTPSVDREIATGGDFAAGEGPTHYGTSELPLQANEDLELSAGTNGVSGSGPSNAHIVTVANRGDGTTYTLILYPGGVLPICGGGVQGITLDVADSGVSWRKALHGQLPWARSVGVVSTFVPQPSPTDSQSVSPQSLANGSAEAVKQAGANVVAQGTLVFYRGTCIGTIATAADQGVYIAIKGHLSGTYYAVIAPVGGGPSGSFRLATAEKLDIVWANADTVAHEMALSWDAWPGV